MNGWILLAAAAGVGLALVFAMKWWNERNQRKSTSVTAAELAGEHVEHVETTTAAETARAESDGLEAARDAYQDTANEVNNNDSSLADYVRGRRSDSD